MRNPGTSRNEKSEGRKDFDWFTIETLRIEERDALEVRMLSWYLGEKTRVWHNCSDFFRMHCQIRLSTQGVT